MATNDTLLHPDADQNINMQLGTGFLLEFDFNKHDAAIRRDGQDLVITISDAVELTLQDFFNNLDGEAGHPFASVNDALFKGQIQPIGNDS